ncbi:zinc finger protein 135-like isoform X7 [Sebastes umbrosus]|uniref:zinc finger protein 135-like isoform X7 n=1 Tax=Sebastes umbrosus TaxID=72105 RepID=UPI00189F5D70|nr:zinc finger protein 135-like isoform X7 [Sebastes umbrosus]
MDQRKLLDVVVKADMELRREAADVQQLLVVKEEVPPEQKGWTSRLDQEDPEPPHIKEEQEELWTSLNNDEVPVSDSRCSADVQQLLVVKEEVPPEQQEWSSSLDQEDPEPPHIKEEQEELWTSQEGEQLQWLEEADIIKFPFTPVLVKSEDVGEKPQSSQLHQRQTEQMETEAYGEDCGGPEPARNSDPDRHQEPDTIDKTGDSSELETDDVDYLKGTRVPQSGLNSLNSPVVDSRCSADVQQLFVVKEEVPPEQQEWSSSLDQEDPEPPHIKEEQEELWTSQEGEQLQGLEEADIIKFTFTPVTVKSEDDEEKPQSSQLHQRQTEQMETEADGEDCGGPEPARNSDPDTHLQPDIHVKTENDDSDDWKETREPQSGLNSLNNNEEDPASDLGCITGERLYHCTECGKRFGLKGTLKVHMRSHTGERPFGCSVCKKSFTQSGSLQNHMRVHTGEKPFDCSVCGKGFSESGTLKKHMRTHTGEKPFICSLCGKRFIQKVQLTHHMTHHTEEKPFSCSVCGKAFSESGTRNKHMRTHTGEKPFSCSVCGKSFAWRSQVKSHKCVNRRSSQLHQTQTEENREAEPPASSETVQIKTEPDDEECGGPEPAGNSDPDRYLQPDIHVKTETDDSDEWKETRDPQSGLNSLKNEVPIFDLRFITIEKPFSCSDCGKRFGTKGTLKVHMRSHTGEKPFSCSFCKKSFAQSGSLQNHMRIHTGEKPFNCSVCGKAFSESVNLKRHLLTHIGEKPFSCSLCGKRFIQKIQLTHHMMHHTEEKPFSCSVCGKAFRESGTLKKHMRTHTGEKPFSCSVCNKSFAWRSQVKSHKCVDDQPSQLHQTDENREAEPPASSSTVQIKIEADEEDCGGPEPARNSDPHTHLQPDTVDKTGDCSESETAVIDDWMEPKEPQSGLNSLNNSSFAWVSYTKDVGF